MLGSHNFDAQFPSPATDLHMAQQVLHNRVYTCDRFSRQKYAETALPPYVANQGQSACLVLRVDYEAVNLMQWR